MISVTEIVLIIAGFAALVVGYLIPAGQGDDTELLGITEREIQERVNRAIEESKSKVDGMVDDSTEEGINRAERAMERLTNEKMTAIGEYSDTVMNDIHKSHEEVVFMYEMLSDKQQSLKSTVTEMTRTADEARQTMEEAARSAREAADEAKNRTDEVRNAAEEARARTDEVMRDAFRVKDEYVVRPEPEAFKQLDIERERIQREQEKERIIEPVRIDKAVSAAADAVAMQNQAEVTVSMQSAPVQPQRRQARGSQTGKGSAAERFAAAGIETIDLDRLDEDSVNDSKIVPISEGTKWHTEASELYPDPLVQNRRILELHNAGKSNMVIARELGLGIGEVKLVIDLSQKGQRRMAR